MSTASNSPRVCLLTDSFHPIVGGGETHARLLSAEMTRQGAEVHVVTRRRKPESPRHEILDGFQIHRVLPTGFDRLGKYFMMPGAFLEIVGLRKQIDVIYVCGMRTLGVVGVLASKLLGRPCVLRSESCGELSGDFIWTDMSGKRYPTLRFLVGWLVTLRNSVYRRSARFLAISSAIRREFEQCGVRAEQIVDIPNGIDLDLCRPIAASDRPALRSGLGLPKGTLWIYTGKLNRGKGLESLLRVWTRVAEARPDAHLVLVGAGADQYLSVETDLRAFVDSRGLKDRVTFTGYVTNVDEYLRACDFFVLPSESEALPLSLIEAMATGLPSVGTTAGGMPDIITHGRDGLLVTPGDDQALFDAMERLMSDPELAGRLGESARRSVVARYAIERVSENHLALFMALTGQRAAVHAG